MPPRDELPSAHDVARTVRDAIPVKPPVVGLLLGSGLGGLADRIEDQHAISYSDLPGFAAPTVPGHAGRLHVYEGHSAAMAAFPVRVLHALGAPVLLLSNAAGGIRRTLKPGDLMIIRDHVNFTWRNPLIGPVVPGDERFPDMSDPWDPALRRLLAESAAAAGIPVTDGVYFGLSGPSYETPAEVRMLEQLGADAVGMSTVHEVIVARAIGMRVAGVSCITNLGAGLGDQPISHAEVLEVMTAAAGKFENVATQFVRRL